MRKDEIDGGGVGVGVDGGGGGGGGGGDEDVPGGGGDAGERRGDAGVVHVPDDAQGGVAVRADAQQHVPVQLHARGVPDAVVLPVHHPHQPRLLLGLLRPLPLHQVLLEHRQAPFPLPQRHRPLGTPEALHAPFFQHLRLHAPAPRRLIFQFLLLFFFHNYYIAFFIIHLRPFIDHILCIVVISEA